MARATRSLPTPLSPRISTVASVSAMLSMIVRMARIFGLPSRSGMGSVRSRTRTSGSSTALVPHQGPAEGHEVFGDVSPATVRAPALRSREFSVLTALTHPAVDDHFDRLAAVHVIQVRVFPRLRP